MKYVVIILLSISSGLLASWTFIAQDTSEGQCVSHDTTRVIVVDTVQLSEDVLWFDTAFIKINPKGTYSNILSTLNQQKTALSKMDTAKATRLFTSTIVNKVFPHWYGTDWDFNGITNTPGKGYIACGYFISTTLKHCGFNLNRYKFAQQYSLKEVTALDPEPYAWPTGDRCDFINNLKNNLEDGLYILGLSSHVGFIYIVGNEPFFIHSDPMRGVIIEREETSAMIEYSSCFYLGRISNNPALMASWLQNSEIHI